MKQNMICKKFLDIELIDIKSWDYDTIVFRACITNEATNNTLVSYDFEFQISYTTEYGSKYQSQCIFDSLDFWIFDTWTSIHIKDMPPMINDLCEYLCHELEQNSDWQQLQDEDHQAAMIDAAYDRGKEEGW